MTPAQIAFCNRAIVLIRNVNYYKHKLTELEMAPPMFHTLEAHLEKIRLTRESLAYAEKKLNDYPFYTDENYTDPSNLKKEKKYIHYSPRTRVRKKKEK